MILGAMLSRLLCKDSVCATSPRKHDEAPQILRFVDLESSTCFRGDVANDEFLQTIRESMAPGMGHSPPYEGGAGRG